MLLVPTYLGPSTIQGLGLFTSVPLPAGREIWTFHPSVDWRFTPGEFRRFPEPFRVRLREWCYEEPDGQLVLCGDNAKFMNHSFSPNCIDLEWRSTVTLREIEADEELTCDYRLIDAEAARTGLIEWLEQPELEPVRQEAVR